MELSYEEAQKMLKARIDTQPEIAKIVNAESFKKTLSDILSYEEVDPVLLPVIENEALVILAQYAPLCDLGKNIAESAHLPTEKGEDIALMINTLLFSEIYSSLLAFEYLWNAEVAKIQQLPEANKNLLEKLELRPEGVVRNANTPIDDGARPLTREEVLRSIAPSRTMAKDIESLGGKSPAVAQPIPVQKTEGAGK